MADFLGDFAIEKLVVTFVCALQFIVVLNFFFKLFIKGVILIVRRVNGIL